MGCSAETWSELRLAIALALQPIYTINTGSKLRVESFFIHIQENIMYDRKGMHRILNTNIPPSGKACQ